MRLDKNLLAAAARKADVFDRELLLEGCGRGGVYSGASS